MTPFHLSRALVPQNRYRGPRMVCTSCGIVGAYARPNWKERTEQESLTGRQWN
jgi:hypothetical protein